jgi:hypothetical protein
MANLVILELFHYCTGAFCQDAKRLTDFFGGIASMNTVGAQLAAK